MPLPPFHIGPSLFLGVALHRWINVPVFVVASLAVDLEVPAYRLLDLAGGTPRYGHTFLIGGAIGVACALLMLPFSGLLARLMRTVRLPGRGTRVNSVLSGLLGAWLHVAIDGAYRLGVGVFWPLELENPLCRYDRADLESLCVVLGVGGILLYFAFLQKRVSSKRDPTPGPGEAGGEDPHPGSAKQG